MMDLIKRVRETTGAGMMDVKKALTDANGDYERAVALLRERGIVKAAKKAEREASDGLVRAYVTPDGHVGALVVVNSETDFVARNETFQALVADLARHVAEHGYPGSIEALNDSKFQGGNETVGDVMKGAIAKIGENLVLRQAERLEDGDGTIVSYVHANNRIGVLVDVSGPRETAQSIGKDIALHIAAERPRYLTREEVDATDLEKEREILTNKALNEGKPQNIVDRIVSGQLAKFYEDNVLLEQKFVKDNTVTVSSVLKDGVQVKRFVRYEIGTK
jgi:elongation factor Ts